MNKILLWIIVCFNSHASTIIRSDMIDSIVSTFPKIVSSNCKILCLDTGATLIEYGEKIYSSGMTRVIITNKNGVKFLLNVDNANEDIKPIMHWLEQFYTTRLNTRRFSIKIPIIYGNARTIEQTTTQSTLLLTKNEKSEIQIIYRYKTIIKAPINNNDEIGYIVYRVPIYKQPIIKPILAGYNIQKSNWIQCINDSIHYLLFGSSWFKAAPR